MAGKFRIGLFTSAWDEVAWQVVDAIHQSVGNGSIPGAAISFVFCSREPGETQFGDLMIRNVTERGLPLVTFPSLTFQPELRKAGQQAERRGDLSVINRWRLAHDAQIERLLPPADLNVLVGWMWVFGDLFKRRKIINLHPALPNGPEGTYKKVIWRLIEDRASETGVMIHLVTKEVDRGPPIAFCRFSIRGPAFDALWEEMEGRRNGKSVDTTASRDAETNPLFAVIRREGVKREPPLLIRTIKSVAEGSVRIEHGAVTNGGGRALDHGYDLTEAVEGAVEEST